MSDAVAWLEGLTPDTDEQAAGAAIRRAAEVAERLDMRAHELHREIDVAIDTDMAAIGRLTRELRAVYFDRNRIRNALNAARAAWPQLFDVP